MVLYTCRLLLTIPLLIPPPSYPPTSGLIKDFEDYLNVLKSVHAGTDLGVAVDAAGGSIPGDARGAVDSARRNRGHPPSVLQAAVEASQTIQPTPLNQRAISLIVAHPSDVSPVHKQRFNLLTNYVGPIV